MSRVVARLLGGDITVESTVGVGSTFLLEIPTVGPAPDGRAANDGDAAAQGKQRAAVDAPS